MKFKFKKKNEYKVLYPLPGIVSIYLFIFFRNESYSYFNIITIIKSGKHTGISIDLVKDFLSQSLLVVDGASVKSIMVLVSVMSVITVVCLSVKW